MGLARMIGCSLLHVSRSLQVQFSPFHSRPCETLTGRDKDDNYRSHNPVTMRSSVVQYP